MIFTDSWMDNWVNISEPHTGAFNFRFCLSVHPFIRFVAYGISFAPNACHVQKSPIHIMPSWSRLLSLLMPGTKGFSDAIRGDLQCIQVTDKPHCEYIISFATAKYMFCID